jgi:SAM-dependent methyltransferase
LEQARIILLRKCLNEWKAQLGLETAWDIGCGLGSFSTMLMELGFKTRALDGREDNAAEAGRRNPGLHVCVADVEDPALAELGASDLVICFGLLYHLENPFRAIRSLRQLTGKILVIESVCTEDKDPKLLLLDENPNEDQGLRYVAFYPSESCLTKMLYLAGFPRVYGFTALPDHPDFSPPRGGRKVRTMLAAAQVELSLPFLIPVPEPFARDEPWVSSPARSVQLAWRLRNFATKPWAEKAATMRRLLGLQREG